MRRYRRKPTHGGAVKWRIAVQRPQDEKPPAGRNGTFDRAQPVESAFALLSGK